MNRALYLLAFLGLLSPFAAAQELAVSRPFASATARENFRICYPKSVPSAVDALASVSKYSYILTDIEGCPPGVECRPDTSWFRSDRLVDVDANALSRETAEALAFSFKQDGCSFSSVSNFTYNVNRRVVQTGFHYAFTKRACWGDFKTDKYSVSADILATVNLNDDLATTPSVSISNKKGSVLGVISVSALENVFKPVLYTFNVVLGVALEEIIQNIKKENTPGGLDIPGTEGVDVAQFGESTRLLDVMGAKDYLHKTDINRSGFVEVENGGLMIQVVQSSYEQRYLKEEFIRVRRLELDFLRALGEVSPSEYIVREGDTLWDLVYERYGDGRLFDYVATRNNLKDPDRLRLGQTLQLPHWQDLCRDLGGNPNLLVQDDDTLWDKAEAGEVPSNTDLIITRSGDPNVILPYEVLTVKSETAPN